MADGGRGGLVWLLGVLTLILRIILWPFRRLAVLLFPSGDFDGLSPAVTAKAVQHFVSELRQLTTTTGNVALDVFATSGFNALRSETNTSLILLYLDSPLHRKSVECKKRLLLTDSILQFLNENSNAITPMGVSIHTAQGAQLAQLLNAASYPLVALLQPSTSSSNSSTSNSMQLIFRVEGPLLQKLSAASLLSYLQVALRRHQSVLAEAEARRIQRQQEVELRREQDLEYQETLRADQERQRLAQEAERLEQERILQQELQVQRVQQEKQERLDRARALIKTEPTAGGTRVRFVLPTGAKIDRRFESTETIQSLKAFLLVHFHDQDVPIIENIGLSTNYPKKSYQDQEEMTLEEAGLSPQAVLMVQDLDA